MKSLLTTLTDLERPTPQRGQIGSKMVTLGVTPSWGHTLVKQGCKKKRAKT